MDIKKCKFTKLQTILDERGNLTIIESGKNSRFKFKREFYMHKIFKDVPRGGHAVITCDQLPFPHLSLAYQEIGYKRGGFPITEEIANTKVNLPCNQYLEHEKTR
ncbi:WxcM-like domain-containing protein [Candidatus Woesebacteria bacterium]|nr:MAG: WxcM-like domain-containing protein [Candidatus Woesebacteria bacterium]